MDLFERVKRILLQPREEWLKIAAEDATPQSLYLRYIMILAAIGPVMGLLTFGALTALRMYVSWLIGSAVLALIVDWLAASFGGSRDYVAALKLTAYSFTAPWVGQIVFFVPWLGGLIFLVAGVYGFYLFFLGAPVLKKCATDRAVPFTTIVLLCTIVLAYIFLYSAGFGLVGMGMAGMPVQ